MSAQLQLHTDLAHSEAPALPDFELLERQRSFWDFVMDRYFRLEFDGFERVPDRPCLLVGNHGGGALAMDGWMMFFGWWRRFGRERPLHGTAHDVLLRTPGLGGFMKRLGVIPPSRSTIADALTAGRDVLLFPGGEQDALRAWTRRDEAVLAGRKGFVRLALQAGVPILPVATAGGHDCEFILSEGRMLARLLGLKKLLRSEIAPITLSVPFGVTLEVLPWHVPLPAKIRTEILDPIELDPARASDEDYIEKVYDEVEEALQAGVERLAARRRFPIFG